MRRLKIGIRGSIERRENALSAVAECVIVRDDTDDEHSMLELEGPDAKVAAALKVLEPIIVHGMTVDHDAPGATEEKPKEPAKGRRRVRR